MKKYYAGIGSRESPPEICEIMSRLGAKLEKEGWTLRSGNAEGADQAFARDVDEHADIYLPSRNFNVGFQLVKIWHNYIVVGESDLEAVDSLKFHPVPDRLSPTARKMLSRNYRQIIGKDGAPNSKFVVCWTEDWKNPSGGTSQAIRIANHHGIKVINLRNEEDLKRINQFLI